MYMYSCTCTCMYIYSCTCSLWLVYMWNNSSELKNILQEVECTCIHIHVVVHVYKY